MKGSVKVSEPLRQQHPLTSPCSDCLVLFEEAEACHSAEPDWEILERTALWSCLVKPKQHQVKGYPIEVVHSATFLAFIIGEIYPPLLQKDPLKLVQELLNNPRRAAALNGHFFVLAYARELGQWHAWTNRFGTVHVYYGQSGKTTALGLSYKSVASSISTQTLDWEALTGFMGFGFFPADRTHYTEVKVLEPARHYVFDERGQEVDCARYWDWQHRPESARTYAETVDQFGSAFLEVMNDLLASGKVAIPISGGLDSRSTVAAVPRESRKERFWSYSYGYSEDSIETSISRKVAAARELPFQGYTIEPYLFGKLPELVETVQGFQDVTQCRQAYVAEELFRHADFVIAAHWGDVWLDDMGLTGLPDKPGSEEVLEHTFGKIAKRGRQWLLKNLCSPHLGGASPEEYLRETVRQRLKHFSNIEDPDFRVKAFKTENWSFRWTLSSIRTFQSAAFPRLPFYDTRIADFFCTVPSDFVAERRLQIDFLRKFAPDLARITWQAAGADLYHLNRSPLWGLPVRALRKAARLLSGREVRQRNWEVQFGGEQGRRNLESWLVRPGLKLHQQVPQSAVRELVDEFYRNWPDPSLGYTVSMLLTYSAWLEGE